MVKFNKKRNEIVFTDEEGKELYVISPDECYNEGACLNWIHQVLEKRWFTPEMSKQFLKVFFFFFSSEYWMGR